MQRYLLKLNSVKSTTKLLQTSKLLYSTKNSKIHYVNSPKAPKAVGPYSQAVKVNDQLYVSGCIGFVPSSGELVEKFDEQVEQALINMKNVLEEGGSSLSNVLVTNILLTDMNDFQQVNEIYSTFFEGDLKPARACYAVKELPKGAKFEITAIALVDGEEVE
eukprot:gene4787-8373_t